MTTDPDLTNHIRYRGKALKDYTREELQQIIYILVRERREEQALHAGDLRVLAGGAR